MAACLYREDTVTGIVAGMLYRVQKRRRPTTQYDSQIKIIHYTVVLVHPKQSFQIVHESGHLSINLLLALDFIQKPGVKFLFLLLVCREANCIMQSLSSLSSSAISLSLQTIRIKPFS